MSSALFQVLGTVVGPLVVADEGELFVCRVDEEVVHLHLRGRFSGCPGNALAIQQVIEPALRSAAPDARIRVTTGEVLPPGATAWRPPGEEIAGETAGP